MTGPLWLLLGSLGTAIVAALGKAHERNTDAGARRGQSEREATERFALKEQSRSERYEIEIRELRDRVLAVSLEVATCKEQHREAKADAEDLRSLVAMLQANALLERELRERMIQEIEHQRQQIDALMKQVPWEVPDEPERAE